MAMVIHCKDEQQCAPTGNADLNAYPVSITVQVIVRAMLVSA